MQSWFKEEVLAAHGGLEGLDERCRLEPEVKEACASNLHWVTSISDVKLGDHVSRQLPWVQFPGLGQCHEGVGLVIAEFRVRTGADQNVGNVSLRQNSAHRPLEALFDEFMGKHCLKELNGLHGWNGGGFSYVTL
jgi:hypothetical protein